GDGGHIRGRRPRPAMTWTLLAAMTVAVMARVIPLTIALFLLPLTALAAPDEDKLGKELGYPIGDATTYWPDRPRAGSFSAMEKALPRPCTTAPSPSPTPLKRAATEPQIRFGYPPRSIDDYLASHRTTGLLIIRSGEILVERYQYDRTA